MPPLGSEEIEDRAHLIWRMMLDECKKQNLPRVESRYGSGYHLDATISSFARRATPDGDIDRRRNKTLMNAVRQYLKATGNVVVVQFHAGRKKQNRIFVRDCWAARSAIPVIVGIPSIAQHAAANREKEARRLEAKVTPEEAGETREPAPVITTSEEEAMQGTPQGQDANFPDFIRYSNGKAECQRCHKTVAPQGMAPHAKMHENEDRDARLEALEAEVVEMRALASKKMNDINPTDALGLVSAFIATLQADNAALRAAVDERDTDATAKVDMIREVVGKFAEGSVPALRALSDINDILEA